MSHRLDDLIQRALDGELSAAETGALESALASDATARSRHEELGGVFRALATARMVEAPIGMRESILHEIRRAPAPAVRRAVPAPRPQVHAGPASPSWRRFALPGVAGVLALVAMWLGGYGPTWNRPGEDVSGTMLGNSRYVTIVGSGARAVRVKWTAQEPGFVLGVRTGATAAHVELGSTTPGVRMAAPPGANVDASGRLSGSVAARTLLTVHGTSEVAEATILIRIRYPDGETLERSLLLHGLRPARGSPPPSPAPTSETSKGH